MLVDPAKLAAKRIAIDEMLCLDQIRHSTSLSATVLKYFDELGMDLYTQQTADGWWFASTMPCGTLADFRFTPTLIQRIEDLFQRSLQDEYAPNPRDTVLAELASDHADELTPGTVIAATEWGAIMAALVLCMEPEGDIAMSADRVQQLYPIDPGSEPRDFWLHVAGEWAESQLGSRIDEYVWHLESEERSYTQMMNYYAA